MPFPPGPFDPTFEPSSFPSNSVSTNDREWFANLFNFSRVPWDVLFLFGIFTAIVGFLIAHWWLTQRMRKYKDRIRILDHEDAALKSIYPREEEGSFPNFMEEGRSCVPRDPNLEKSDPSKCRVRFSDPVVEEDAKKTPSVASVPIKMEPTSIPEEPLTRKEYDTDVTIVPPLEPSPPIDVSEEDTAKSEPSTEKKGKTTPSPRTKKPIGSAKKPTQTESVSEIATVSDT